MLIIDWTLLLIQSGCFLHCFIWKNHWICSRYDNSCLLITAKRSKGKLMYIFSLKFSDIDLRSTYCTTSTFFVSILAFDAADVGSVDRHLVLYWRWIVWQNVILVICPVSECHSCRFFNGFLCDNRLTSSAIDSNPLLWSCFFAERTKDFASLWFCDVDETGSFSDFSDFRALAARMIRSRKLQCFIRHKTVTAITVCVFSV